MLRSSQRLLISQKSQSATSEKARDGRISSRAVVDAQEEGQEGPQCCLCPVAGGALKRTTEPGLWCHAACMQWIPEVTVEDLNRMEPVSHIKSIQKEHWDLNCSVCRHGFTPSFY